MVSGSNIACGTSPAYTFTFVLGAKRPLYLSQVCPGTLFKVGPLDGQVS